MICSLDGGIQASFTGAFPKALGYLVPLLCLAWVNQKLKPWWEGLTVQEQRVLQQRMVRSELYGDS